MNSIAYIVVLLLLIPLSLRKNAYSNFKFSNLDLSHKKVFLKADPQASYSDFLADAKNPDLSVEQRLALIIESIELKSQNEVANLRNDLEYANYRYKKGIEVLKMLYEKILALDHHFTSLRTFRDIQEMSNPNSVPEFANAKLNFKKSTHKKSSIDLPEFLDNNPFVSAGYTLIASIFGEGNKKERTAEIDKISCLLDFTLSMHTDMKIIFYETDYLRTSNRELMQKCRLLFSEYTKVISYPKTLDYCRNNDDWDNLFLSLENRIKSLNYTLQAGSNKKLNIQIKNIEFNLNRLIKFIENYDDFISQGEQYYQKFQTIVNSYENRTTCDTSLPSEFAQLEEEITFSIQKFKTAYNMAELKGSKLRDLIYGNPEDI